MTEFNNRSFYISYFMFHISCCQCPLTSLPAWRLIAHISSLDVMVIMFMVVDIEPLLHTDIAFYRDVC